MHAKHGVELQLDLNGCYFDTLEWSSERPDLTRNRSSTSSKEAEPYANELR